MSEDPRSAMPVGQETRADCLSPLTFQNTSTFGDGHGQCSSTSGPPGRSVDLVFRCIPPLRPIPSNLCRSIPLLRADQQTPRGPVNWRDSAYKPPNLPATHTRYGGGGGNKWIIWLFCAAHAGISLISIFQIDCGIDLPWRARSATNYGKQRVITFSALCFSLSSATFASLPGIIPRDDKCDNATACHFTTASCPRMWKQPVHSSLAEIHRNSGT